MGFIDSLIEKHNAVTTQREDAISAASSFIANTELFFKENKDKFIAPEWNSEIRKQCKEQVDNINKLTTTAVMQRMKLLSAREELETLSSRIGFVVQQHNDTVARSMIGEGRKTVGLVEGRELDEQQMMCIVKPAHNHLVIAGAGTGKTTTIVGKVKYLLNSGKSKPEDILVLSFTNASAAEMSERINKEAGCKIAASTFHKLGIDIISKVEGTVPKITRINLVEFTKNQLSTLMKENKYVELFCNYFLGNYKYDKTEHDFSTRTEYEEYLRINPPTTLDGVTVKSYGEMDIANFLFRNGIDYCYEKEYEIDTRTEEHGQYYPDFYLPQYKIYIEYFGIDRNKKVPSFFSSTGDAEEASKEYCDSMEWKRKLHRENNTKLLEFYAYEKSEGNLLRNLQEMLVKSDVKFNPLSAEQVWQHVTENNGKDFLATMAELFATVISLIKSNNLRYSDFKAKCMATANFVRNEIVVSLIEPIYDAYEKALQSNGEIDFNDMINLSSKYVLEGKYKNVYKFVIVDEYQDISKARFNLLKSLRQSEEYDLFCVGDDWQSIYRFAGSDMGYILDFAKFWGDTTSSKIETTYRFTKNLIEISGAFVMNNPAQIRKQIKGKGENIGFALGEIKGYTEQAAVSFMLKKITDLPASSSVYFIGRYSFDAKILDSCSELVCHYDNQKGIVNVIYHNRPDLKMSFITAHRSKGLQADYVFIINNKAVGLGFPSTIQNDPVIDVLLEGQESYPFAEERRLFYVALTRAKKKTFLLTIEGNESIFAKELEQKYEKELKQEKYSCPLCGGKLERKTGQYGDFYGCSNYRTKGCKYIRNIEGTKEVPVTKTTNNLSEQNALKCPNCGKQLMIRTAKKGSNVGEKFYGCSGYPNCKYTRKM